MIQANTSAPRRRRAETPADGAGAVIIAVGGLKGGVGKTTVAGNLAEVAQQNEVRVLAVDADCVQASLTKRLRSVPVVQLGETEGMAGADIGESLQRLTRGYQIAIVDCPGWLGRADSVQTAVLLNAHVVLFPTGPADLDRDALGNVLAIMAVVRARQEERIQAGQRVQRVEPYLLLSRINLHFDDVQDARARLRCELPVLETVITERLAHRRTWAHYKGVTATEPRTPAAREVRALSREVVVKALAQEHVR